MQAVNKNNKCFIVWNNEVEGRLDTLFYSPDLFETIKNVKKLKSNYLKFGEIIEDLSGGATPKIGLNFYSEGVGIPFLRVQNITEEGLKLDDVKYIKKEVHNSSLKRSQLKDGELVFTITGRIGSVAVIPVGFEGNINQHSVRIRLKKFISGKNINPKYVAIFFNTNIGRKISMRYTSGGTRPALDYKALKELPFILPSLEIQNKIVEIMQFAYDKKADKEKEAEDILNSVGDYVLRELEIKIKNLENKSCFIVNSNEVEGRRLDPKGYLDTPQTIVNAINKAKFKIKTLAELVETSVAGEWGEDPISLENNNDYSLVKVLRNTNFDNQGNLNFEDVAERLIENKKLEKVELKKGDILIEKSGGSPIQPVGRVALIENLKEKFTFSNFLQCFRIKKECLPEYLFCFLKTLYGLNYMEYLQNQTTGIKNLIMEEYLSMPIPLPPVDMQKKLANEFRDRLEKSIKLKEEAKNEIEKAKQEVEKIILSK